MKINHQQFIEEKIEGMCCWYGCHEDAEYPAPKSPSNLKDKYTFCLNHAKLYNKSWNFFEGMKQSEIESFYIDSITGHRPTSRMGVNSKYYNTDELKEQIFREFKFGAGAGKNEKSIPDNERDAIKILGLNYPITMKDIKRKYKELAKLYHPDVNGHKDEDKLKVINQAYSYLKTCGHF